MEWLKKEDYINAAKAFVALCIMEAIILSMLDIFDLLSIIFFLIMNIAIIYCMLNMKNKKYIEKMKRKAKENVFIEEEEYNIKNQK